MTPANLIYIVCSRYSLKYEDLTNYSVTELYSKEVIALQFSTYVVAILAVIGPFASNCGIVHCGNFGKHNYFQWLTPRWYIIISHFKIYFFDFLKNYHFLKTKIRALMSYRIRYNKWNSLQIIYQNNKKKLWYILGGGVLPMNKSQAILVQALYCMTQQLWGFSSYFL